MRYFLLAWSFYRTCIVLVVLVWYRAFLQLEELQGISALVETKGEMEQQLSRQQQHQPIPRMVRVTRVCPGLVPLKPHQHL